MIHGHMDDHTVCMVVAIAAVLAGLFFLVQGRLDNQHWHRLHPKPTSHRAQPLRARTALAAPRPPWHRQATTRHRKDGAR